jgi:DNA-binding IclR family transcriptional regulator
MQHVHTYDPIMQSDRSAAQGSAQALTRGLTILRHLVEADGPLTATELAQRCGMHQSTASRILQTLAQAGYVSKEQSGFIPDYGVLALAVSARGRFAIMQRPRAALEEVAARCDGLSVALCMLWRQQVLYFLRMTAGGDPTPFDGDGYPMHLSLPALRLLADMPEAEATGLLARSREQFGWHRPSSAWPADEASLLARARAEIAGTIPLRPYGGYPLALAIYGPREITTPDKLRLQLHEARRDVETALESEG